MSCVQFSSGKRGQFLVHHGYSSEPLGPHPPRFTTISKIFEIYKTNEYLPRAKLWFWRYCLGPSGYLFSIRHCSFGF